MITRLITLMTGPWGSNNAEDSGDKPSAPDNKPAAPSSSSDDKPRSPWEQARGSGPRGNAPNLPPNLEDLLRRHYQARGKKPGGSFSGGPGSGPDNKWNLNSRQSQRSAIMALIAGAFLIWIGSGFYRVEPDEQGVVLRFGEAVRMAPPGLSYHLPMPIETVLKPKVTRVNRREVDFIGEDKQKNLIMTRDENIIDVNFLVNWQIKDAQQFLFNVQDPEETIEMAAESVMREVIGQTPIQAALTEGRQKIEQDTMIALQELLDEYKTGVQILQVQLQKVDQPPAVIDAFRDVQRARAEKEQKANNAQAEANNILPRAKGEAEKIRQEAEAYREQTVSRARGEAQRFSDIYEAYKMAPDITAKRIYIETMENVMRQSKRIILDSDAKGSIMPVLPLTALPQPAAPAPGNAVTPPRGNAP